jgi:endoglucanase
VRDTTPPSPPGNLSVGTVTASQVSLSWDASTDNSGIIDLYQVSVSPRAGNVVFTGATSATVVGLAPTTAYTFTVRARDAGWNFSQPSNAVTATTEASTDPTPPTAPVLQIGRSHTCEIDVRWTQSTDDQDPQAAIRYELFDNGSGPELLLRDWNRPVAQLRLRGGQHLGSLRHRQRRQPLGAEQLGHARALRGQGDCQ